MGWDIYMAGESGEEEEQPIRVKAKQEPSVEHPRLFNFTSLSGALLNLEHV